MRRKVRKQLRYPSSETAVGFLRTRKKLLRYLFRETMAALYILTVLIGWPAALLMLARKVGLGGLALGFALLATYILMVVRGGYNDGQA